MFKNTSGQKIAVFAFDTTTGAPKTGDAGNITVYVNKDWAGVNALTDTSATEIDSTNAKGWYLFDVSQTESNADALLFTGKSSTANISIVGQLIYTAPANYSSLSVDSNGRVDVIKVAGTSQTARDLGASVLVGDKTGFSLTQTFPTNFSSLGITAGGHISTVDTLTTYTGNTVQTGDSFGRIGAAGAGLTALGDTRVAHLDADISGRMATYTQPTGFLAATFPATVASPTNITAGTITTVTNLTNAPSAGDFTSTMKTSLNAATPAVTVSDKTGFSLSSAGVQSIWDALTSALTTVGSIGKLLVTNIDAATSSRSSYAGADTAGTTTLLARLTSTRAGLLDNIDAAVSAVPTADQNADALLDRSAGIETNRTMRQGFRLMLAALLGKASGLAGTTATFRDTNDLKDRIVATVDADGNRTAVTLDAS